MQSSGKGEKIRRDDLILAGIIDANSEDIVDGSANQFAFFFIELLKKQNIKVYPIDASRLNIAKNKLAYLMKSQKVMGDFFYLESNWHKLDLDNFLGFYEEDGSPVLVVHKGARYYYVDPYNNTSVLVTEENKDRIRSFAFIRRRIHRACRNFCGLLSGIAGKNLSFILPSCCCRLWLAEH